MHRFPVLFCLAALVLLGSAVPSGALAELPAQVKADLLIKKLSDAIAEERHEDVLSHAKDIRALGVPVPPSLSYFEALAASETGDVVLAEKLLAGILPKLERGSELYDLALQLYARIEPEVAGARAAAKKETETSLTELLENKNWDEIHKSLFAAREAGVLDREDIQSWATKIDQAQTAEFERLRKKATLEELFQKRLAAAISFFEYELNNTFNVTLEWVNDLSEDGTYERADHKATYDQTLVWRADSACELAISTNHSVNMTKVYSHNRGSERTTWYGTTKGSGSFFVRDGASFHYSFNDGDWANPGWRLPGFSRKSKNFRLGVSPYNIRIIDLRGSGQTYSEVKRKNETFRYSDGEIEKDRDRTDDDDAEIVGTVEQLERLKVSMSYLKQICKCRTEDSVEIGDKWYDCATAQLSPPIFHGPKPQPVFAATKPKDEPTFSPSSDDTGWSEN